MPRGHKLDSEIKYRMIKMLEAGVTHRKIAERLNIYVGTVSNHARQLRTEGKKSAIIYEWQEEFCLEWDAAVTRIKGRSSKIK